MEHIKSRGSKDGLHLTPLVKFLDKQHVGWRAFVGALNPKQVRPILVNAFLDVLQGIGETRIDVYIYRFLFVDDAALNFAVSCGMIGTRGHLPAFLVFSASHGINGALAMTDTVRSLRCIDRSTMRECSVVIAECTPPPPLPRALCALTEWDFQRACQVCASLSPQLLCLFCLVLHS